MRTSYGQAGALPEEEDAPLTLCRSPSDNTTLIISLTPAGEPFGRVSGGETDLPWVAVPSRSELWVWIVDCNSSLTLAIVGSQPGWLADIGFMVFVGKTEHGTIPYLTQGRGRTNIHSSASLRDGIKIPLAEQGERAVGLLEK